MSKTLKLMTAVIAAVLILSMALVACSDNFNPLQGGEPDALSESNSGYVVKQGKYYYFVNGYNAVSTIAEADDNKFGSVLKGAIMRTFKNADGTWAAAEVVVPKLVVTANNTQGFSIFGNHIYYASPSTQTDKYGKVQTSFTEIFKADISGANTKKIATLADTVKSYKFTPGGLLYLDGADLKCVTYDKAKETTVAEGVSNPIFEAGVNYDPKGVISADNYVFYTQVPKDTPGNYNELYAVTGGAEPIKLIGDKTFGADKTMTVTPKFVKTEDDGAVAIYYEKTDNTDGKTDLGLYGIKLAKDAFKNGKYNFGGEKRFTNKAGQNATATTFERGVIIDAESDADGKYFYFSNIGEDGKVLANTVKYKYVGTLSLATSNIVTEGDKTFMYIRGSGNLLRVELIEDGIHLNSSVIIAANIKTDWLPLERIGDDVFFFNTKYLTYIHVFNMSKVGIGEFDPTIGFEREDLTIIGEMTKDDKESYDEMLKKEKEEKEESEKNN